MFYALISTSYKFESLVQGILPMHDEHSSASLYWGFGSHAPGNWTLPLRDTLSTGQFAYCLVISPTGHFAYLSFRL